MDAKGKGGGKGDGYTEKEESWGDRGEKFLLLLRKANIRKTSREKAKMSSEPSSSNKQSTSI